MAAQLLNIFKLIFQNIIMIFLFLHHMCRAGLNLTIFLMKYFCLNCISPLFFCFNRSTFSSREGSRPSGNNVRKLAVFAYAGEKNIGNQINCPRESKVKHTLIELMC